MAPPRDFDPAAAGGSVCGDVTEADYVGLCDDIARTQGVINAAEAHLVELTRRGLEIGVSGGDNLPPKAWLAWKAGISPERASSIVKIAERADDLPATMAALAAGELTVDQAAVVARHVPVRFEASAAQVAPFCTVAQLRKTLPHYRDRKATKPDPEPRDRVASRTDESGYHLNLDLADVARGAVIDQALRAMYEDLRRKARADAPDGVEPEPVSMADAMVALAETAIEAGEAARPGTDRYLVHVHLEDGPDGISLMTHLGIPIPDGERRHLLCDARLRATLHDGIAPVGCGRTTRVINRRLRRAIEHRDRGCCTVPGCGRTTGLEIHHIWHWEDGGPTETPNLITLCGHHHRRHHRGTLGITGNADEPRHTAPGVVFTNTWGHRLDPTGTPVPPVPPQPGTDPADHLHRSAADAGLRPHHYQPPTGERLDPWGFHLQEADPADPTADGHLDADADADADPPPNATGPRADVTTTDPASPASGTPADPTRAGPARP